MVNKTLPLYPAPSRLFGFGDQVRIACAFQAFNCSWMAAIQMQAHQQNRKKQNRTELKRTKQNRIE
jgi:hypothetical protein